ncbi:MAG: putative toxin-antitoxin system toxin component, PIN family [Sulfobacillus benefaciens]|uniref:Putative toxin-antitoxin system toxin component, PIN family n=1 Tax=Sulfobacillus benefaciens TaxID=453960 RepID=A0A2T2XCZ7_9FIRM|nr:MAG: putative toxin-antitoxin system toxin component, PIN family [Sulfobacillus benefaciens]
MIRVVLDTNVLVSAVRADRGPLAAIREGWLTGQFQVYVSKPLLDEVERTLTKPYFAARLGPEQTDRFLTLLKRTAVLQPIIEPVTGVATHPEDDWILATAQNAQAQFLVTGDKALHALGSFGSTRLIDPAAFADYPESTGTE